ncbi:tetratricopeptide repeat protein [Campylobacter gastrosuis]|uniref:beta-lactamase n=1 Tax=Campylobacter gastrosuis TaxID=2974576 RepID=A0ABT7HMH9_9BACT|nr:tetratricopeptide repeat protein [Campylobacter gastrosuis]MDL0088122.1 sel1 repeat family protein [Campylobacter gastrosuis]
MKKLLFFALLLTFFAGCGFFNKEILVTNPKVNEIYKGVLAKENGEYKRAFDIFEKASKNGNEIAMYELGRLYFNGLGTQKDYKMALYYFKLAGFNQNSDGLRAAGQIYELGLGTRKDIKKAIKFYELAQKMGNNLAIYDLANLYLDTNDMPNAKIYFKMACKSGVKEACERIK